MTPTAAPLRAIAQAEESNSVHLYGNFPAFYHMNSGQSEETTRQRLNDTLTGFSQQYGLASYENRDYGNLLIEAAQLDNTK